MIHYLCYMTQHSHQFILLLSLIILKLKVFRSSILEFKFNYLMIRYFDKFINLDVKSLVYLFFMVISFILKNFLLIIHKFLQPSSIFH